jgi:hypothetical protein
LIVNFRSYFKSIEDLDNFGEIVPSRNAAFAADIETLYLEPFF